MVYRALLIANGTFPDDATLPELNGPKNDIVALREKLTDPNTGLFHTEDVTVCADRTRPEIWTAVREFSRSLTRSDTVLVYYSGHGIEDDESLFLAAHDTIQAD